MRLEPIEGVFKKGTDVTGVISNALGRNIDVTLIGHFNNVPQVLIDVGNQHVVFGAVGEGYSTIGYILDALYRLFDFTNEDGRSLSTIKDFPLRVARKDHGGIITAIGHFTDDKWLVLDDLNKYILNRLEKVFSKKES